MHAAFGSGGAFGQQQPQQPQANPMFGGLGGTSTAGAAPTSGFGMWTFELTQSASNSYSQGSGAFGSTNTANTGTGLFGAPKPATTGFGAFGGGGTSTGAFGGGGAFGTNPGASTGTGMFGGAQNTGTTSAFGGGSIFGNKPATAFGPTAGKQTLFVFTRNLTGFLSHWPLWRL